MPPRKRLGQLLTELGVVDEHQLQSALGHQKQWGGKLGAILVQKGFCKEDDVVSALSKHLSMPSVKLSQAKIDERAVKCVSKQIAEKLHVFPYELSGSGRGEVVTIAMSDPTDLSAVDQLAFHTGKRIKPMLAGDSEIVSAVHQYYGSPEEKKQPTDKLAKPAAAPAPTAQPAAPAGSQFPRRIDPQKAPTPAGGTPRVAPYIPPPIPAAPARPAQKLEEIEPDESMKAPPPPPPQPEPLDLPESEDDGSGQMMGLEPIAAHTQVEEVAGAEELSGAEGSAADAMEGLESASVPHEGAGEAQQMEGLEPIAAHTQDPGWEAQQTEGWETQSTAEAPTGAGWTDTAESAPAASAGWGDESPAPEAAAAQSAAQEWGAASAQGWGSEQPAGDSAGEQLPMDAIIGTAVPEGAPAEAGWGEEQRAAPPQELAPPPEESAAPPEEPAAPPEESAAPPEESAAPPEESAAPAEQSAAAADEAVPPVAAPVEHLAEAPDAWASSEDPLAAQSAANDAPSWGGEAAQQQEWNEQQAAAETAVESAAAEAPAETEAPPEWAEPPAEETPAAEAPAEEAPAAEPPAEETPTAEPPAEETFAAEPPAEERFAAEPPAEERYAAEPPAEEAPPPEAPAEEAPPEPPAGFSQEQSEIKLEGWVAPPPEPEPQGAGWMGQALEAVAPLSPADLGTLAAVGVDPNDGVAALRLLAALVRVLHRRQLLELDEVAAEIRESRAQGAAAAAEAEAQSQNGEPAET